LVKVHADKNGCYECPERYNCICLSSVINGVSDNSKFNESIKELKLGIRSDNFNEKIKKHYDEIVNSQANSESGGIMNSFFFQEIKKPEFKEVKEFYVNFIKKEYISAKEKSKSIGKIMINMENFFEELNVDIEDVDE
jgi:hypothetical protein